MLKKLFGKKNNVVKVEIADLKDVLVAYNFNIREKSVMVKKQYILKGQEMNRVYIQETKKGLSIIDGWNSPIMTTTKKSLINDLQRLYNGDFSGGESNRVFYKDGVPALY